MQNTTNLLSCFERTGYTVEVDDNIENFAALRSETPDHVFLGPTFDPEKSDQSQSKWILAKDDEGSPAAFVALRRFDSPNLNALVRDCRIWFDNPTIGPVKSLEPLPRIGGICYYRGGMYVFPGHRKSGLAWGLAMMGQMIACEDGANWIFANAFPEIVARGIPFRTYGFEDAHAQQLLGNPGTADSPMAGRKGVFYLLTCNRKFFTENIRVAQNLLISRRNDDLLNISLAYERDRLPDECPRKVV